MKRLLLPPLAILVVSGLLLPQRAYACSCAALTPQAHVDKAQVVVIGTVVREAARKAVEAAGGNAP